MSAFAEKWVRDNRWTVDAWRRDHARSEIAGNWQPARATTEMKQGWARPRPSEGLGFALFLRDRFERDNMITGPGPSLDAAAHCLMLLIELLIFWNWQILALRIVRVPSHWCRKGLAIPALKCARRTLPDDPDPSVGWRY